MARFLPALRGKAHPGALTAEAKAVYSEYYNALWQYETHRRAKPWPVERAVTEGFERVIWVFKAVNTIASDSARLPFRLRQGKDVLDDHPLYNVLNKTANPLESGQVFRKRLSAQISLSKAGAFVEVTKSRRGDIIRVDLLPPDRTEIIPGKGADLVDHVELVRRDGSRRPIDWDKVLWFRDPHPLDPYSGVTPLESAGMSVELDYFARLYNVSFMRNDGRPGGVLGVKGPNGETRDISPAEMDRIESRFGKGPVEAGKLSVIAGELSYTDLATRPRDMQYGQTSRNSKIELLSAYGVPESVMGYSAERTFDNADNELYVYWTRTQPAHIEIMTSGFNEDTDDDLEPFLDTSDVEVLERAERARRDEARTEVDKGLRSIYSYAKLAGIEDEIDETPMTRALYIPQGRTPLPSREEDAEALGLGQPTDSGGGAPEAPPAPEQPAIEGQPGGAAGEDVARTEQTPPEQQPDAPPTPPAAPTPPAGSSTGAQGAAAQALAAATRGGKSLDGKRARLTVVRETKAAEDATGDQGERVSDLDQRARDRLEDTIAAALTALASRWTERTIARLESPKSRKGTRHWEADGPNDTRIGNKALDAAKAVDEDTWSDEAETGTEPIVTAAAVAAAAALAADLGDDDATTERIGRVVAGVVRDVMRLIAQSAARQAAALVRLINHADQDDRSMRQIVTDIRATARLTNWAEGVAEQVATATTNGARDAVAAELDDEHRDITREWVSRMDGRQRDSHGAAHGQVQAVGAPFIVGESLLRYPGDPLAPVRETANCRCWLRHRSKSTGRFVPAPAPQEAAV